MLNKNDEVFQYLNREISYWQGMKSREFWKEFVTKRSVRTYIINLSIILAGVIYLSFVTEVRDSSKLLFLLGLGVTVFAIAIYDFLNYLQLFRLKNQLEIIRQAQQLQDSKSE